MRKKQTAAVVTWQGEGPEHRAAAARAFAEAICKVEQPAEFASRSKKAEASNTYLNIESPSISVRDGFDRDDYEYFRDGENVPKTPKGAMKAGMEFYNEVGIVRNVIDLMTDFAVKGIGVEHPSESASKFYKEWFRRVNGYERSASFLKQLFLNNTVIVRRHTGKIPARILKKWKRTQGAQADAQVDYTEFPEDIELGTKEIPVRYSFLNPLTVDVEDENIATLLGPNEARYVVKMPRTIVNRIKNPRQEADRQLKKLLPADVIQFITNGGVDLPLNPEKVSVYFYKKDDWVTWPMPFLNSIYTDLHLLKKMKLADLSALDGAISSIRVWKLGDLDAGIYPPESVLQRLAEMLTNHVAGGMIDLVWGPDIDLLQTNTEIYKFLGDTKYAPILNAIFQGLGVPATLNGTGARPGTGFTNNYMSLQTFVERLEYGRQILRLMWETELRLVQKAMGHRRPASLYFDNVLSDEPNMMKLYLDMADRNIISSETLQELMNIHPELERIRLRKESTARSSKRLPAKAGPFHDANAETGLWKILAQTGAYTPEELGLEGESPSINDAPPAERTAKIAKKYTPKPVTPASPSGTPAKTPAGSSKPKGQPGQGRPTGKKDERKRKQKVVRPRTGKPAAAMLLAVNSANAQLQAISSITTPLYLEQLQKKTLRELTTEEAENFESFKFCLLCAHGPEETPTRETIQNHCQSALRVPAVIADLYKRTLETHVAHHGKEPSYDERRYYMASLKALQCISEQEAQETSTEEASIEEASTEENSISEEDHGEVCV